jgi:hypothetical protein
MFSPKRWHEIQVTRSQTCGQQAGEARQPLPSAERYA